MDGYTREHIRRVVAYPAAVANGASSGVTTVTTPDDNYPKRLIAVHVDPETILVEIDISGGGYTFEKFDASRSADGDWPIICNEEFPSYILFAYNLINNSGGSITAAITFEYVPDDRAGGVSKSPRGA